MTGIRKFVVLLLSALALVSILFSAEMLYRERNQIKNAYGDFIIFYTGAQILRDGKGRDLYDLSVQNSYQSKFDVPIRVGPLPYNHPPFELLWHLPLSFLDYYHAYLAWSVVNMILLVLLYRIIAPWQDAQLGPMFGLMFLGFYPIVMAFLQGQDSILLTLLLAGAFANLKQKKGTIAGMLFALALIKPQFAVPSVVALVVRPNRTATKAFLGMVSLLIVISLLMVGTNGTAKLIDLLTLKSSELHHHSRHHAEPPRSSALLFARSTCRRQLGNYCIHDAHRALVCNQNLADASSRQ